jgi:hypothetical protein
MSCEIERLSASWLSADAELQRQQTTLRQLEHSLSREGAAMNCAAYMELQSRIAQQQQRFEASQVKAASALAALDEARSDRAQREIAQRRYDARLSDLENAKAKLAAHREHIATMNRDTPLLEHEFNLALAALDHAKGALHS